MPLCIYDGCDVSSPNKMQGDGFCRKHSETQRNLLKELVRRVTVLEADNETLKAENVALKADNASMKTNLNHAVKEIETLVKHVNDVRGSVNSSNYQRDEIEQYGRLESWRAIDIQEEPIKCNDKGENIETEDCAALAIEAAELIGVSLKKTDIQRAHRIGRRRVPFVNKSGVLETPKPRQLIVKLKDYGKRTEIMLNKKNLQENAVKKQSVKFQEAFLVEDLTPLRSKMLWYAKKQCNGKFKNCHTRDGRIKAQRTDTEDWVTLSNPDDFHRYGVNVDINIMNKGLRKIQILKDLELPKFSHLFVS